MQDVWTKLEVISEMLADLDNLYLWQFDSKMNFLRSNCPDLDTMVNMLEINSIPERISEHFPAEGKPLVLTDPMGFAWAVDCMVKEGETEGYFLLGPAFTSPLPEQNLTHRMGELNFPLALRRELLAHIGKIPVIHPTSMRRYAIMLHYCITGTAISSENVGMDAQQEQMPKEAMGKLKKTVFHGTWNYEQQMLKAVQEGDLTYLTRKKELPDGAATGTMCPGDPLRQAKDEAVVLAALCARAAIMGGMSAELAYTLSDYYIQNAEGARSMGQVYAVNAEIIPDYINRVRQIRENSDYSQLSRACVDYVSQHITEKIQVSDMASSIGYADYYLTSRFKKDTGISLRDYINQQKVERAKLLLSTTKMSIQQVADELNFSSPSYFCAVFRKVAGISPGEFRDPLTRS